VNKYIIMGVQGSGKGTQANLLKAALGLVHISVGDIFRWHMQNRTKLASRVKRIVSSGGLVPNDIVNQLVQERLGQHDWNFGFILDGFPRDTAQAQFYLENYDVDAVIYIDVPDEVVMKRVLARRLCSKCGADYNLIFHPPTVADTCDTCGGKLAARPDDNPQAIAERLSEYHGKTEPALALFEKRTQIVRVDGQQAPDAVQKQIRERLASIKA
jgi:adenylate kinase